MRSIQLLLAGFTLIVFASCEKCMSCSYSYTETEIIQTVNGEEEQVNEYTGRYILDDNGNSWRQECINSRKGEQFTIENAYEAEKQSTTKENFEYTCVEQ